MANAAAGAGIDPALPLSRRQIVDIAGALTPAGTGSTIGPTETARPSRPPDGMARRRGSGRRAGRATTTDRMRRVAGASVLTCINPSDVASR